MRISRRILHLLAVCYALVLSASAITVTVSSPQSGATVTSPTTFVANATSNLTVTGWVVYVDSTNVYQAGQTNSIKPSLSLSPGTHNVIVRAWDSSGAFGSASLTLNVAPSSVLWKADMETGDMSEWYFPSTGPTGNYGGGVFNSGIASTDATTEMAHSGQWGAKMTISTPSSQESGTRLLRWMEPRENRSAYYSVWVFIPTLYTLTGDPNFGHFVNLLQFKTRTADNSRNDPVWAFYIDDSQPGQYYLKAGFDWGGTQLAGPYSGGNIGGKWYKQSVAPLPIGRWVHLEAFLKQSNRYTGQLTLWQDGVKLFDFQNVITSYKNCNFNSWCADNEWSVNLYSDGLSPDPAFIYVDDAEITTGLSQSPAPTPLSITTSSLSSATAGSSYTATLSASGGTPPYTWSLASGQLPPGLTLSASGVISGIPITSGSFSFTPQAKDVAGNLATRPETIQVAPGVSPISSTTGSLPGATVGTAYQATLAASGGTPPYTWSVVSGQLPSGLTLSINGVISGTPNASGTFSFMAQVKDSAASPQAATQSESIAVASSSSANVLWSADMETGDLSQWYFPSTGPTGNYGGGEFDSGIASAAASTEVAHTGSWGAKLSITTPASPQSGTRMFRWLEPRQNQSAYYSVWVYFPTYYTLTGDPSNGHFLNLMQFKTRTADNSRIDPVWAVYLDDSHPGQYYLKAGYGWGGTQLAGPYASDGIGGKWFNQTTAPLPVGKWVHLEFFLKQSNSYNGQLTVWQDGVKLFDFQNVITSYNNCNFNSWCADDEWSVNLYSDGLTPNPSFIYIDDAKIADGFIQ